MSDFFHKDVPDEIVFRAIEVMRAASWHQFQILTKRSRRLALMNEAITWPKNVWMGVSVESQEHTDRIEHRSSTNAHIKFLSLEPLLGPISSFSLKDMDWVIVGGESGSRARPVEKEWVINIRDRCIDHQVPFFFKQWGGKNKKKNGRSIDGQIWNGLPKVDFKCNTRSNNKTRTAELY